MSEYRFGFSEFTTWPWPYERDATSFAGHGATDIEVCEFKLPHNDYGKALASIGRTLRVSSVQMQVHSVFPDTMAAQPEDPEDRIAAMKASIAQSAPHLAPGTPFIVITGAAPDRNVARAVERTAEALKDLGDAAGIAGMSIAFEPLNPVNVHTDTALWRLDRGLELVERVAHPSVGICIDTWNVWEAPDVEETIRQCADRIRVVQLSDWRLPRSTADRYCLGDGEIPLAPMMRAIRSTGYDGPWLVEILSSMHLEGSLWKADLDDVLERNRAAFARLWSESAP